MDPLVLLDTDSTTREHLAKEMAGLGPVVLPFGDWREARRAMWSRRPAAIVLTDWSRTGGRGAHRRLLAAARGAPFVMVCDGGVTEWDERFAAVIRYPPAPGQLQAVVRATTATGQVVGYAGYRLDRQARALSRGRLSVRLTPLQTELLFALMQARGQVVPVADLAAAAWPEATVQDLRPLYTHLAWLRRRIADAGVPAAIRNERGQGYRFDARPAPVSRDAPAGG